MGRIYLLDESKYSVDRALLLRSAMIILFAECSGLDGPGIMAKTSLLSLI